MGHRTVVILANDEAHLWEKDPELGRKIAHNRLGGYGNIAQVCHADTQTLAVLDSYCFSPIARKHWQANQTEDEMKLELLHQAAVSMGYELVKRSQ